jgi:hypothetical protein
MARGGQRVPWPERASSMASASLWISLIKSEPIASGLRMVPETTTGPPSGQRHARTSRDTLTQACL